MELEALFDAVIVKPIEAEETTFGNIIVPDLGKEKNEMGTNLKVGDRVVLPTMGFTKLPYNGEEYYVGPENQILAKVKSEVAIKEAIAETEVSKEEIKNLTELSNE